MHNQVKSVSLLLNNLEQLTHALFSLADYEAIFDYMLIYTAIRMFHNDTIEHWKSSRTSSKEILKFKELTAFLINRSTSSVDQRLLESANFILCHWISGYDFG